MLRASVFDLDHTLFHGNSSVAFGRYLFFKGELHLGHGLIALGSYLAAKAHLISLCRLHQASFPVFRGRHLPLLLSHVDRFLDLHLNNLLAPSIHRRLKLAQQEQQKTLLLSNSPDFLVEAIGKRLGIDESVGTAYAVDESGCLVDVSRSLNGNEKRNHLALKAKEWQISLSETAAYSDSILDLPLLQSVGCPVAAAPDRRLKRVALKESWEVVNG